MHSFRIPAALAAILSSFAALAAQSLSGRVVSPTGQPIAGVDVDTGGGGGGSATTNAAGLFTITPLAVDTYDVEYLPASGAPWAARMIPTSVTGATNVGDIVLQPGFVVSGTARNEAGTPLFSCNLNVYDAQGTKLFTPNDSSDLAGNWSIVVPVGPHELRILPPVGAPLVPYQADLTVNAPVLLGTTTLRNGLVVTGTVADSVTAVPIAATRIRAFDAITGQRIELVTDTTNTFGQFSILLPFGTADLEFSPPLGNTHAGRKLWGVVVPAPLSLGTVGLKNGALVSGTVTGPTGAIAGADVDVLDTLGTKQFTAHDATDATGLFRVAVPFGAGWQIRVEPPAALGLFGYRTAPLSLSGPTSLGTIPLTPGLAISGTVAGPNGPEANARLVFTAVAGRQEIVTVGDRTSASGSYTTYVPAGTYEVRVEPAEGSAARAAAQRRTISAATTLHLGLKAKLARCTLTGLGTPTLLQGGLLFVDLSVQSLTGSARAATIEFVVRSPSEFVQPITPPLPIVLPTTMLSTGGVWLPLPPLPPSEVGRLLRAEVRLRDATTGALLDDASTEFFLQ